MVRYADGHKTATRHRILNAAQRVINTRGVAGATVEAVMREAGLTVGGFYAHFASKDALARAALMAGVERTFARLTADLDAAPPTEFARAMIQRYLAQADASDLAEACPLTLLLPDVARGEAAHRQAFAARTDALLASIEHRLPQVEGMAPRDVALAVFATLAGAVSFARAATTPRGRQRIIAAAETSLHRLLGIA